MNQETQDTEARLPAEVSTAEKKRYSTPRIISFGPLHELTGQGQEPGPSDGIFLSDPST